MRNKQRVLIITPLASRWLQEVKRCMEPHFELHIITLQLPQTRPEGDELRYLAVERSQQLGRIINKIKPDGIYLSIEFGWELFLAPEFFLPFDPQCIISVVFDDIVYHDLNVRVLEALKINRLVTTDLSSKLRYLEKGFECELFPLEGSEEIYYPDSTKTPANDIIFFGMLDKADRRQQIEIIRDSVNLVYWEGTKSIDQSLTYQDLAQQIRNSKLVLNLSKSHVGLENRVHYQWKGRILESMFCGVLPVTEFCPCTSMMFGDLVPQFKGPNAAVEIIRGLLAEPDRLKERTAEACQLAERYRPSKLWGGVEF